MKAQAAPKRVQKQQIVDTKRAAALFACFPAFAEDAAAVATSGEISPFAGVVDISVLALLAYFAKLGNEKAARESASKTKVGRNNGKKK